MIKNQQDTRITATVASLFLLALSFIPVSWLEGEGIQCPSKFFLHLPCPLCGITHATLAVLHGNWKLAWQIHPGVFLLFILYGILFLFVFWYHQKLKVIFHKMIWISIAVLILIYALRLGGIVKW